ncbi:MAG: hypothetical protein ACT4N5_04300 [Nitrosopumilaceae archaeon]
MKQTGVLLLAVFLTGTLVNSTGLVFAQTNSASTTSTSEENDNLGQYVSDYVHEHIAMMKQQRAETIDAIKKCREDLKNADDKEEGASIKETCKTKLKEIREKYRDQREEYRKLFKEYRDEMKTLIKEARGQKVSTEQKEKAMDNLDKIKETHEKMKEERQATKDNKEK